MLIPTCQNSEIKEISFGQLHTVVFLEQQTQDFKLDILMLHNDITTNNHCQFNIMYKKENSYECCIWSLTATAVTKLKLKFLEKPSSFH